MHKVTNIPIIMLNPLLTCKLCGGYLIDATTVIECLHSFCRSCIVSHLKLHTTCPVCDTLLHKTRPHYAIRPDRALQAMVYKLIPNLFEKEMAVRRKFYREHPDPDSRSLSPEKKGEITLNAYVIQEEEHMSLELEYWQPDYKESSVSADRSTSSSGNYRSTYLLCPPDLTVGHLEKLIRMKFELKPGQHKVAVFFSSDDLFGSDYTLSDLACLHSWRRHEPFKLYFTIVELDESKRLTPSETPVVSELKNCSPPTKAPHSSMPSSRVLNFPIPTTQSKLSDDPESLPSQLKPTNSCTTGEKTKTSRNAPHGQTSRPVTPKFSSVPTFRDSSNTKFFNSPFPDPVASRSVQPISLNSTIPVVNKTNPICSPRA